MMRRIGEHLRSNVVGYIALFLVLTSGTAYALAGSNTVYSDDIVNGEVKTPDVALDAITSNRIANGQVRSIDVLNGGLTGTDIQQGTLDQVVTDTTPTYEVNVTDSVTNNTNVFVTASCDSGDKLQAGGYVNESDGTVIQDSAPASSSSWTVELAGFNGASVTTRIRCWDFPPLH
jgi:hypothetical protein